MFAIMIRILALATHCQLLQIKTIIALIIFEYIYIA